MNVRYVTHAHYLVVIEVGLLDGAIPDRDAFGQCQAHAIDQTALRLGNDIIRLYRNPAVNRAPEIVNLDAAFDPID